jgi:putative FmdB family regulatory protein
MPFYEYECPSCRYYLEVLQKISDKALKKCPSCGKSGFKRLMSAPKPEAGAAAAAAADKGKSESAASPTDAKSAKASTSAGRSLSAKRTLKRAAPRAKPKSARGHKRAKRGR